MLMTAPSNLSAMALQRGRGGRAMLPFDPVDLRDFWLQTRLQYTIADEPRVDDRGLPGLAHTTHERHAGGLVADLVSAILSAFGMNSGRRRTSTSHGWSALPSPIVRSTYSEDSQAKAGGS